MAGAVFSADINLQDILEKAVSEGVKQAEKDTDLSTYNTYKSKSGNDLFSFDISSLNFGSLNAGAESLDNMLKTALPKAQEYLTDLDFKLGNLEENEAFKIATAPIRAFGDVLDKAKKKVDNLGNALIEMSEMDAAAGANKGLTLTTKVLGVLIKGAGKGLGAMSSLTNSTKLLGTTLKIALSPLRGIVALFMLISKLNPFALMQKALDKALDAFKMLKEASEGSTARAGAAVDMRSSEKHIRAFDKAQDYAGTTYGNDNVMEMATALTDSSKQGAFALLGLDPEDLKRMNGHDAFMKVQTAAEKLYKDYGDSLAWQDYAGQLSDVGVDVDNMKRNIAAGKDFRKMYSERLGKDTYDNKQMSEFEKATKRLGNAFEDFINKFLTKIAPIFIKVIDKLTEWIESFSKWLDSMNNVLYSFLAGLIRAVSKIPGFSDLATLADDYDKKAGNHAIDKFMKNLDGLAQTMQQSMVNKSHIPEAYRKSQNTDKLIETANKVVDPTKVRNASPVHMKHQLKTLADTYGSKGVSHEAIDKLVSELNTTSLKQKIDISVHNEGGKISLKVKDKSNNKLIQQFVIAEQ